MTESETTKKAGSALLEGEGIFKDFNGSKDGKPVFETKNPLEWEEHAKQSGLTQSGSAPCAICSTVTTFEGLAYGKKPVCEKCKGELT